MVTEFKTILTGGQSLYKDKGSKFLGFAFHVKDEEEVKSRLNELRKEYYDARHHCYAYVLGSDRKNLRANDDGEPNHSAGDPILGQIHSRELTNTLIVVIRYFGGTKLGVGGLINAYKIAAEESLKSSTIVTEIVKQSIDLKYSYDVTNEVMRLVNELNIDIVDQEFTTDCLLKGQVRIDLVSELKKRIQLLNDTGFPVELI